MVLTCNLSMTLWPQLFTHCISLFRSVNGRTAWKTPAAIGKGQQENDLHSIHSPASNIITRSLSAHERWWAELVRSSPALALQELL